MSIARDTLKLRFDSSGFNASSALDTVPQSSMVGDSLNIKLNEGGIRTRGGTAHVDNGAMSGIGSFLGLYDFTQRDGTNFVMRAGDDGGVYKDDTNTIRTGASSTNYYSFATIDDSLFFCDGASSIHQWNGVAATSTAITTPNANWGAGNYPKQLVVHGKGLSRRLWTFCEDNILYGSILLSSAADAEDFNAASSVQFYVQPANGEKIRALYEFGDTLFIFTDRQSYYLEDSSTTDTNWTIRQAYWEGGVAHWRLIARTPNDLVCMQEDGYAYSVTGVQSTGDYQASSITRPAFIDKYIRENSDLSKIEQFHCQYNPATRAIYFFIVETGKSRVTSCLPYFIDRSPLIAWGAPHKNDYTAIRHGAITGTFTVGEKVTGGTSTETAIVVAVNTTDLFMQVSGASGDFSAAEVITGTDSGATTTTTTDASLYPAGNGYHASVSALIKTGTGSFDIYTGDYYGYLWKLEQSTRSDDGYAYTKGIETPELNFGDERSTKFVSSIVIVGTPTSGDDFSVRFRVDGLIQSIRQATMDVAAGYYGQVIFGVAVYGESNSLSVSEAYAGVGTTCKRLQPYIYDSTAGDDFFLSEILIDFKMLGKRPAELY